MQPIIKFNSYIQALECLDEWKYILGLQNWIIGLQFTNEETQSPDWGYSETHKAIRIATIFIPTVIDAASFSAKYCEELIIVHECLHIKMQPCDSKNETVRAEWHAILEDMAKGYLMARYDINFTWFENDGGTA